MTALKVREVEGRNRIMVWKDVTCVCFYTRRCSSVEQVAGPYISRALMPIKSAILRCSLSLVA